MFLKILFLFFSLGWTHPHVTIHIGPPAFGGGGSNPVSIPPSSLWDYEVILENSGREWVFGISPGIFYGRREKGPWGYLSLGGGLVSSKEGLFPGLYTAVGKDFCGFYGCWNWEIKKALGWKGCLAGAYALRTGVSFDW